MKILQIHNFYRTRGGECRVVQLEHDLLKDHGHEVLPYYRDSREIDGWGGVAKSRMFFSIPYSKIVEKNLIAFVQKERPDVAHIHNVFPLLTPAVYRALKKCATPVVQTIHNFRFLCPNGQFYIDNQICEKCQEGNFFSAIKRCCVQDSFMVSSAYATAIALVWKRRIFPHDIDRYIVLNRFFAERLIRAGVPRSSVQILGNFVFYTAKSVPLKSNYILYLGRLSQEKGVCTLLDAWERIAIDGVALKIAGSGPLSPKIEVQAAQMGDDRIKVLGHVSGDAKQELIRGAICMVVPSEWYENFPLSIVEAMSQGTPVVVSRVGGLPELVKNGVNGLVFEPGDSYALEKLLRNMITDQNQAARLANNALKFAHDELGPKIHYDGLMDIYTKAIGSNRLLAMTEDKK